MVIFNSYVCLPEGSEVSPQSWTIPFTKHLGVLNIIMHHPMSRGIPNVVNFYWGWFIVVITQHRYTSIINILSHSCRISIHILQYIDIIMRILFHYYGISHIIIPLYIRLFPYIQGSFRCIWDSRGVAALAQTPSMLNAKTEVSWLHLVVLRFFLLGCHRNISESVRFLALNCLSVCYIQVYPIIGWSFWWPSLILAVAFDTWSWWSCWWPWKSCCLFEMLGSCQWSAKRCCSDPIQTQSKSCEPYVGICCEVQRWQFWAYCSSCRSGFQADIGTSSQLWQ